jgi:type II secretory pathway predicted ATPase ExeA
LAEREERVFASYPQVSRYFPAAAIEDARQRLSRAIERGEGPGLLIGAPGTGKSLLLQVLAAQHHKRFDVALLACACLCTRRALLQAILFELGMPYKMRDEGELRLSLLDHLLGDHEQAGLLLLVDEAQTLPTALLDELRVLTNLMRGGAPRVRLVLAGSSALEESFASPLLESFSQRLSTRCYVAPLSRDETYQFIRAQVAACDTAPDEIFDADALAAIFDATDGVPRLVNQLCDRALVLAAANNSGQIHRTTIQAAWSDLQQIPTPWETPPAAEDAPSSSPVIEFGGLADDALDELQDTGGALLDTEPTELDVDDESPVPIANAIVATGPQPALTVKTVDPFAEKFDEEEVVIDNFAAWDDMFRRDTPRVANRREPQFAPLIQAAIAAAPVPVSQGEALQAEAKPPVVGVPQREPAADGPRLRLVGERDQSDSASPFAAASSMATRRASTSAAALPVEDTQIAAWEALESNEPILVVEEDSAPHAAKSPVRREDYRQLFSRLRSG